MRTLFILLLYGSAACAQQRPGARNITMQADQVHAIEYQSIRNPDGHFHPAFRPWLLSRTKTDSSAALPYPAPDNRPYNLLPRRSMLGGDDAYLSVLPVLDLEAGADLLEAKMNPYLAGGIQVRADYKDKLSAQLSWLGGAASLPFFQDTTLEKTRLIPELGQLYAGNGGRYQFSDFMGYLSYSPNRIFNFQLGKDRHFIGDGYRSLLLSDFAPAYPYFRINTNVWKLQYNVWYTVMNDVSSAGGMKQKYRTKYGTFHYLSFNAVPGLNFSIFENIVWRGSDSNQVRTFEVNYLNPVIFYRPQEYSVGSPDNSFLGATMSAVLFKRLKLYGQVALDEFYLKELRARRGWWANKQGWQAGLKYVDAFNFKGLSLQAEYNLVRPYTYTHGMVDQNYSHFGQPLAHPLGANFKELQAIVRYNRGKVAITWQLMHASMGIDSLSAKSNVGQNIFLSYTTRPFEYGHKTGQGLDRQLIHSHLKFGYLLMEKLNLWLEMGYIQRSEQVSNGYILQDPYVYLGLRNTFYQRYRDY